MICPTCQSKGFDRSVLPDRCTFCDGTEGGNPPVFGVDYGSIEGDRSVMVCATCNEDVTVCICPDRDQQLHDLAYGDAPLMFKWCRTCDRHYARCKCATPDFYVISKGKEVPVPAGGFKNAAGGRTMPDLTKR